jgi:UDP-N-acetylmuramate--alanine ligase
MLNQYRSIHFIGIGGIGVSALARLSKLSGKSVSGSDIRESVVTESLAGLGCEVYIGHAKGNLGTGVDLVIHTEDVNPTSAGYVELSAAQGRGIKTLKYSEALGLFVDGFYGIGVSGTNGKSTTTAILGLIMEKAGTDPMVIVGSRLARANESEQFRGNARFGHGKYFVYEADEYHRHMLDGRPKAAIITNLEPDHLDYYKGIDDIKSAFADYANNLPSDGLLVFNADDPDTRGVCSQNGKCKKATFGTKDGSADYFLHDVRIENQQQEFSVTAKGRDLGRFTLSMPGEYNLMNALGALAMAVELGVSPEIVRETLREFKGIWRRFEMVGQFLGKPLISDYAHHPTALAGLIRAAKEFYPGKKILFVYQPHQKNRTKMLFNEFVESMRLADHLILPEIYWVPGREKDADQDISSKHLADALEKYGQHAKFAANLGETERMIAATAGEMDVIVLAGAGTIDQLARKLAG